MAERPQQEMLQKSRLHDSFFGMKGPEPRPSSIATEIVDTDWDEEEILSEIEDEDPNSPRLSLNSSGQQSVTTLSSYEEAQTPRSSRARTAFPFEFDIKPVEGPRGPHLFRMSAASTQSFELQELQNALSLSPITPRAPRPVETEELRFHFAQEQMPPRSARSSPFQFSHENFDQYDLPEWSPEMVAQWMLNAGIEATIAEKFIENDINGEILITLKSEDMKELGIQSFGIRTAVWNHICELIKMKPESPRPDTPIEDEECKEVRRERRKLERCEDDVRPRRGHSKRRLNKPSHEDIISPLESVSIVGIEQVMPKPHKCSKGENCKTFRRQQRMIDQFMKEHPFADTSGGRILVAGDPGNAATAPALNRQPSTEALRPMSDAVPSVVASSDVLGPGAGIGPFQYLQEATLRNVQHRDPQDNVRQFLEFQQGASNASEVPPTPPFELYPQTQAPHEGLRSLPKLSIPGRQSTQTPQQQRPSNLRQSWVPYAMDKAEALSPDLSTPVAAPYRFGSPFSEMDVPVTSVPLGPVARDASQSVPPDMNYRAGPSAVPVRSMSRASRRPSFQVMAPLRENAAASPTYHNAPTSPSSKRSSLQRSPPKASAAQRSQQKPLQAPPRAQYPWSTNQHANLFGSLNGVVQGQPQTSQGDEGIAYQGPVRKRKTKMLRHEWHDQYATLKGTRLALHKDAGTRDRTLEYVDIDDYAIACSSLASGSKLNAAFKAMSISRSSGKDGNSKDDPVAAFSFQLIPQGRDAFGARLKKRESSMAGGRSSSDGPLSAGTEGAVNGTGKTHHFAVKSRDERIDWMRELMLAKALRQKGEGFEVSVNGNMI